MILGVEGLSMIWRRNSLSQCSSVWFGLRIDCKMFALSFVIDECILLYVTLNTVNEVCAVQITVAKTCGYSIAFEREV